MIQICVFGLGILKTNQEAWLSRDTFLFPVLVDKCLVNNTVFLILHSDVKQSSKH